MNPKVSILIPCYNAERTISRAIDSALKQSYQDKEVIIYDDGSEDKSGEIIRSFGNRIRFEKGTHMGANYSRCALLELSQGVWLQYLDADDYLLPDKIKNQMACAESQAEADIVYSQVLVELEEAGAIKTKSAEEINPLRRAKDIFMNLAGWRFPQTGGALFRKKSLIEAGGWKKDQPCCQEHELYIRLLMRGKKFVFCEDEGAIYSLVGNKTLSRVDPLKTAKERMRLTDMLENWLKVSGVLNAERQRALSMGRFECARSAYLLDKEFASRLIARIKKTDENFAPRGNAAPFAYRLVYGILGFSAAEKIAEIKRRPKCHKV